MNTLKFGNGEWYGTEGNILAYNDENGNFKPLPFDFSRGSKATRVNQQGLIETVGANDARVDYLDNANGAMLLEPASTNLINFSEPTSSESQASGITYESYIWAIGHFTNCIKFGDNSQTRYRYFTGTIANSTAYVISAFVIMDDLSEPTLGTNSATGDFILRVGGTSASTGNLPNVNMGNNIYRVSSLITSGASGGTTGLLKYTTQSNIGFRIVGFQVEELSYPTSYIPTQGTAQTRLSDSCSQTPPDGVIGQTEGTIYWEIDVQTTVATANENILNIDNGSGFGHTIYFSKSANGSLVGEMYVSGGLQASFTKTNITKGVHKMAMAYANNNTAFFVDGVQVGVTDTSCTVPSLSRIQLGNGVLGQMIGLSNDVKLYNTRLSNSELAALTQV